MPHDLKEIDDQILVALAEGRNVPSNLAETLDVSRQWINTRLQQMESADYVRNIGRGVYELNPDEIPPEEANRLGLTDDPRGDATESDAESATAPAEPTPDLDVGRLRGSLRAARSALSGTRPDVDTAEAEIDAALEVLGDDE